MEDEIKADETTETADITLPEAAESPSETATATAVDVDGENHAGTVAGDAPEPAESGGGDSDEQGDGQDIASLVAEAERRGYIRGRNERIEELMAEPGVWEPVEQRPAILGRPRRSIWDD